MLKDGNISLREQPARLEFAIIPATLQRCYIVMGMHVIHS